MTFVRDYAQVGIHVAIAMRVSVAEEKLTRICRSWASTQRGMPWGRFVFGSGVLATPTQVVRISSAV
eukprot:5184087-Lingulodinium_polyedra.AAC.1